MIRNAKDLSHDQRIALESLMGQPLDDQDRVSVRRISPALDLSAQTRKELLAKLEQYFTRIDDRRQAIPREDEDAVVDEALRSTRPTYRPIR